MAAFSLWIVTFQWGNSTFLPLNWKILSPAVLFSVFFSLHREFKDALEKL
jgi:hypothetical protein